MYTTDRISKINAMSEELKKFGFCEDTLDAVRGAQDIILSDEDKQESQIFSSENNAIEELSQKFRRFKDTSQSKMDNMSKQLFDLHAKVSDLASRPAQIQTIAEPPPIPESSSQISQPRDPPQPTNPTQEPSPAPIPDNSPVHSKENTAKEEEKYNERQGHYTSDDVKIEDIFYYGNK